VWSPRTKRIIALVVFLMVGLVLMRLSEVVPIVGVAIILAYLLTPLASFFERRVLAIGPFKGQTRRGIAVVLTYILIFSLFIILILVVVPALIQQFQEFGRMVPQLLRSLEQTLEHLLNEPLTFNNEPILINGKPFIPLERLRDITGVKHLSDVIQLQDFNLVSATQSFISSLTEPAFNVVGGALTAIVNLIFLLSMIFFLIRDGSAFIEKTVDLTPPGYRGDVRRLLYELGQVWNAYLRGQVNLSLIMGLAAFTAATFLGLPNPVILGLISALLEFIPSIGSGLAIFPAALLALPSQSATMPFLQGVPFMVVVVITWAALQNIEAIFLVPRVMGGSLNLHPFAVIVGVIAGASLAGVLGIILAAPVVASLRVFGQYIYGKLLDQDPFPVRPPRRTTRAVVGLPLRRAWLAVANHTGMVTNKSARETTQTQGEHDG
jgi:predicted PurR-regulated permease PerM